MVKCLNCGRCCVVFNGLKWVNCKYRKGKRCIIYYKRYNKDLGYGFKCIMRKDLHLNFPGCPYNKPEWNMHPAYRTFYK